MLTKGDFRVFKGQTKSTPTNTLAFVLLHLTNCTGFKMKWSDIITISIQVPLSSWAYNLADIKFKNITILYLFIEVYIVSCSSPYENMWISNFPFRKCFRNVHMTPLFSLSCFSERILYHNGIKPDKVPILNMMIFWLISRWNWLCIPCLSYKRRLNWGSPSDEDKNTEVSHRNRGGNLTQIDNLHTGLLSSEYRNIIMYNYVVGWHI